MDSITRKQVKIFLMGKLSRLSASKVNHIKASMGNVFRLAVRG